MYKQGIKQAKKHITEESRGNETLGSRAGLRDSSKDFELMLAVGISFRTKKQLGL